MAASLTVPWPPPCMVAQTTVTTAAPGGSQVDEEVALGTSLKSCASNFAEVEKTESVQDMASQLSRQAAARSIGHEGGCEIESKLCAVFWPYVTDRPLYL